MNGNEIITGTESITNATASTNTTSGALTVTGGVGVQGAVNIGSTLGVTGITSITNTTVSTNTTTGALVVNGGTAIQGSLNLGNALTVPNGGTGLTSCALGDLFVGSGSNTLKQLNKGTNGQILMASSAFTNGLGWTYSPFVNHQFVDSPTWVSSTQQKISYGYAYNNNRDDLIAIPTQKTLDISTTGINGLLVSSDLSGTIYYKNQTKVVTGTGTSFTTDFVVGDVITTYGQSIRITEVTSDTSLTTLTSFTNVLNTWSTTGSGQMSTTQFKFGTASGRTNTSPDAFSCTLGTISGNTTPSNWTIELWVYVATNTTSGIIKSTSSAFSFRLGYTSGTAANRKLNISLGNNGTSYNIANGTLFTSAIVINTWNHVAIVFNGTNYVCYFNGSSANGVTIASSSALTTNTFNSFIFGSDGAATFPGYIDELRISNTARYSGDFTAPTSAFTYDSNCMILNHFNGTNTSTDFAAQDESIINQTLTYHRGGMAPKTHYYVYMIGGTGLTSGYVLSARSMYTGDTLVDLPNGYTVDNTRQTMYNLTTNASGGLYPIAWSDNHAIIYGLPQDSNVTTTSFTTLDMSDFLPKTVSLTYLVCNLSNKDTTNSVTIGPSAGFGYQVVCNAAANGNIIQLVLTPMANGQKIDAKITTSVASGSTAALYVEGYLIDIT